MSHAPWYYGWWSVSGIDQARILVAETALLALGYVALAVWAVSLRRSARAAGDPALRMMRDDPEDEP